MSSFNTNLLFCAEFDLILSQGVHGKQSLSEMFAFVFNAFFALNVTTSTVFSRDLHEGDLQFLKINISNSIF
jgi:hypothetical protein